MFTKDANKISWENYYFGFANEGIWNGWSFCPDWRIGKCVDMKHPQYMSGDGYKHLRQSGSLTYIFKLITAYVIIHI